MYAQTCHWRLNFFNNPFTFIFKVGYSVLFVYFNLMYLILIVVFILPLVFYCKPPWFIFLIYMWCLNKADKFDLIWLQYAWAEGRGRARYRVTTSAKHRPCLPLRRRHRPAHQHRRHHHHYRPLGVVEARPHPLPHPPRVAASLHRPRPCRQLMMAPWWAHSRQRPYAGHPR